MPKFGKTSRMRLETCKPDLQVLFNRVIEIIDCSILTGHRGEEEQNRLFKTRPQKTRCQWPDSKHNALPSIAVDVAPYYIERPHIRWNEESLWRWYFFGGIVLGVADMLQIPIRWGGDWNRDTYVRDQKFNDLPHFELIL